MPFGVVSGVGRRMGELDGDGDRRRERGNGDEIFFGFFDAHVTVFRQPKYITPINASKANFATQCMTLRHSKSLSCFYCVNQYTPEKN